MRFAWLLPLALASCGGAEPTVHPSIVPALEKATGWTFKTAPVFEKIDRARLTAYLESKMDARTAAAGRALRLLNVLPKDYDLVASVKKLYAQEILALYDLPQRKVFLVREAFEKAAPGEGGKPGGADLVVAHELVHALQHQHDPRLELLEDRSADLDDVRSAVHAHAEGEATLRMYAPLGKADPAAILKGLQAESASKLADQPEFMRHLLYSPYVRGFQFVEATASSRRVPLSTEQLQEPDRVDPPVAVFLPDLSAIVGGGRKLVYESVLGQLHLPYALAGLGLGDVPVRGWGGDRLQLYESAAGEGVVVLLVHWDRADAAATLAAKAAAKPSLGTASRDLDVAIVVGLGKADGAAREALARRVAKPFSSVEELRSLRATLR